MADNINPTRSELLELKKRIKLANKGHSLLKKKQDFLINEFFKKVKEYKEYKKVLSGKTKAVYDALALEIAYNGIFIARSVSYATRNCYTIEFTQKNLMGVSLPQIEAIPCEAPTTTFEDSPQLAEVRRKFRTLFEQIIKLSSMKLAIDTLADEIKKIKRRVNSLEHIQIPKLESLAEYIVFVLAEQERENFSRLKMIKAKL